MPKKQRVREMIAGLNGIAKLVEIYKRVEGKFVVPVIVRDAEDGEVILIAKTNRRILEVVEKNESLPQYQLNITVSDERGGTSFLGFKIKEFGTDEKAIIVLVARDSKETIKICNCKEYQCTVREGVLLLSYFTDFDYDGFSRRLRF